MVDNIIKTERLILRPWRLSDNAPFAALNADARVMEFFLTTLSREESDRFVEIRKRQIEERGWGLWAVEAPGVSDFIGYIGLTDVPYQEHFTPAIEIGWRLAYEYWGRGYAPEGARAVLQYGFDTLGLKEIVSLTSVHNLRSMRVMEKIGMTCDRADDFDHPRVPEGHKLRRHVLYRAAPRAFY